MKKIITYGTFDLLHYGHISLIEKAKNLGDYLIVAVSTDEFNCLKGKKSYYSFEYRKRMVESIKYVDKVIPEKSWNQKKDDIEKYQLDLLVMGSDWSGKFDFLKNECEVIYLPRTKGISTTKIKEDIYLKNYHH